MKIRIIIIVLSLVAFFSIGIGGYLYYSGHKKTLENQAHAEAGLRTRVIAHYIDSRLSEHQKSVKAISGVVRLQNVLVNTNREMLDQVNLVLDHFRAALEVDVCYIMDHEGTTIASSNRNEPDSFVGKSYRFRPYFQQAMQGMSATYMALGVTSGKRGVYFSHPVYHQQSRGISGVVVIKASVAPIQNELEHSFDGIVAFVDPSGVVFAASRPDWLYHTLWKIPDEKKSAIIASQQFGTGPLDWTGMEKTDGLYARDRAGDIYMVHEKEASKASGWKIVYLYDMKVLSENVYMPLFRAYGYSLISFILLSGIAITLLYVLASKDISKRKQAEKALENAHHDLAIRVEERTADLRQTNEQLREEIILRKRAEEKLKAAKEHLQAIYDASPDMIFVYASDGHVIDVNRNMTEQIGYSREEMMRSSPFETSGKDHTPEMALERIEMALRGDVQEFEWVQRVNQERNSRLKSD